MKCPKCGTNNGKTNRFCRTCGASLAAVAAQSPLQAAGTPSGPEDVQLGGELYEAWQLYENGELEAALAKGEKVIAQFPESTSAHSVVALIYERKAEQAVDSEDVDAGRGYLKLAVAEYERIIDLNPDSAADRGKLITLRRKLAGPQASVPAVALKGLRSALRAVPTPFLAAFAVFLVALMLAIILIPGGERRPVRAASGETSGKIQMPATGELSGAQAGGGSEGLKIYTFPGPAGGLAPVASPPATAPDTRKLGGAVEPLRLPDLGAAITITPEPKKDAKTGKKASSTGKPAAAGAKPEPEPAADQVDGAYMLAEAIRFHDQGNTALAVDAAQRAAALFQADVDAGRNAVSARRGIRNAQNLIAVWQQAGEGASGE